MRIRAFPLRTASDLAGSLSSHRSWGSSGRPHETSTFRTIFRTLHLCIDRVYKLMRQRTRDFFGLRALRAPRLSPSYLTAGDSICRDGRSVSETIFATQWQRTSCSIGAALCVHHSLSSAHLLQIWFVLVLPWRTGPWQVASRALHSAFSPHIAVFRFPRYTFPDKLRL